MSVQCYKERLERLTQRFFGFVDDFQGMIGDFIAEFARFIVIQPDFFIYPFEKSIMHVILRKDVD